MSVASRQRAYDRQYRHGFATWEQFRAWQATSLAAWLQAHTIPSLIAANQAIAFFAMIDGRKVAHVDVPDDSPPLVGSVLHHWHCKVGQTLVDLHYFHPHGDRNDCRQPALCVTAFHASIQRPGYAFERSWYGDLWRRVT